MSYSRSHPFPGDLESVLIVNHTGTRAVRMFVLPRNDAKRSRSSERNGCGGRDGRVGRSPSDELLTRGGVRCKSLGDRHFIGLGLSSFPCLGERGLP